MSRKPDFRSLDSLTKVLIGTLKFLIVCYLGISVLDTAGGLTYSTYSDPTADVASQGEAVLTLVVAGLAVLGLLGILLTAICVWRFMHRANKNLRAAGVQNLEFTPGWCIGWWFIPFANLIMPRNAMAELYKASAKPTDPAWRTGDVPPALNTWWAAWIVGTLVSRVENRLATSGVDLGLAAIPLSWASTGLLVVAAIHLILVVRFIRALQNQNLADLVIPEGH